MNPYSKFLEERGPGIHHIKESILDNDALDAAVAEYSSRGPKVNYQGKYMEDHYFYLDTFDALGAYYEMGNNAKVSAKPEFCGLVSGRAVSWKRKRSQYEIICRYR